MKITGDVLPNGDFRFVRNDVRSKGFQPGDEVWALRYALTTTRKGEKLLKNYPVRGVFASKEMKWALTGRLYEGYAGIDYFIPYGPSGRLCYSKFVDVDYRQYATTKEEAFELYNENIQAVADTYRQKMLDVLKDKV